MGCCYETYQAVTEDLRYQDHLLEDDALEEQDLRGVVPAPVSSPLQSEAMKEWTEHHARQCIIGWRLNKQMLLGLLPRIFMSGMRWRLMMMGWLGPAQWVTD